MRQDSTRLTSVTVLAFAAFSLISQRLVAEVPSTQSDHYRFLFCSEGRVLMELSSNYYEKLAEIELMADQDIPWSFVSEREGEEYTAYFFERGIFETVKLKGLAKTPSGDGGFAGIAGVVETSASISKDCYNYTTVGIACTLPVSTKSKLIPQQGKLPRALRKLTREMGGKFEGSTYPNAEAQSPIAIVKQRVLQGRDVVRVFHVRGTDFTELPFPENVFREGKSLLVHDPTGETDVTPIDGEFKVLPDLDGNSYPEFIVEGTGTSLYAIEDNGADLPTIVLKRSLYFGP